MAKYTYLLTYLFISFKKRRTIKKWLAAIRCKGFLLTEYSRICGDHNTLLDYYLSSCMPLKTSVPSSFNFPQHLEKVVTERRQLERKSLPIVGENMNEGPSSLKNFKLSPSKAELKDFMQKQRKEIKTLKQKVRRQQRKIDSLSDLLKDWKKRTVMDQKTEVKLNSNFSGIALDMIKNQYNIIKAGIEGVGDTAHNQEICSHFEFLLSTCIGIYPRCFFFTTYQLIDWVEFLDNLQTSFLRGYFPKFESSNWWESSSSKMLFVVRFHEY